MISPLWGVLLLIALGAIWLIARRNWAAWGESYRALPPRTMRDVALLAAMGLWAAGRSMALLLAPPQSYELPVVAHWLMAALALLAVLYQPQRS